MGELEVMRLTFERTHTLAAWLSFLSFSRFLSSLSGG